MALPELEYISLPAAAIKFSTSIEHVRGLIQSGNLTAYVFLKDNRCYARLVDPIWECNALHLCHSIVLNLSGEPSKTGEVVIIAGKSDQFILVKFAELKELENTQNHSKPKFAYSLEETAELMNQSVEYVFELLSDQDQHLASLVELKLPKQVAKRKGNIDSPPVYISGNVIINVSKLKFDDGFASLIGKVLYQNGQEYMLLSEHNISKTDVFIPSESLKKYMQKTGDDWKETNQILMKDSIADTVETITDARPKERFDALAQIMLEYIYEYHAKHNKDPQCNQIINYFRKLANERKNKVIQDVVDGKVEWTSEKGKAKKTSSKQIQNRLTRLKTLKKIPV